MKIIKCTNGVGTWEIDETHDTFDTYEEASASLQEINQQLEAEKTSEVLIEQWWKQDKEKTA